MSKTSYLSPLLSLSLHLLQRDDVRAWLRGAGRPLKTGIDQASDRAAETAEFAVQRLLDALRLQRRPSTAGRIGRGLALVGTGAAVAAAAFMAAQVDRERLQELLDSAGNQVGRAAQRSGSRLEGWALDEWLEVLDRIGLQRRESPSTRTLRAAGWVGVGAVIGGGLATLAWTLSRESDSAERDQDAPAAEAQEAGSEHQDETAGSDQPPEDKPSPTEQPIHH